jgi:hypothetical protein
LSAGAKPTRRQGRKKMTDKQLIKGTAAVIKVAFKECTVEFKDADSSFPGITVKMDKDGTDGVNFFILTKYPADGGMVLTFCPDNGLAVNLPVTGKTFIKWAEMYGLLI